MGIEKIVSEALRKYPGVRKNIKLSYQAAMVCINKISGREKVSDTSELISYVDSENYFGYYDKSPWCKDESKVLFMKVPYSYKHPENNDSAEVGYYDIKRDEYIKIGETKAWNLQQGCMLQWLGKSDEENIIYNDFDGVKYISKIYNINTKSEKIINYPIYTLNFDGTKAISVNFSRLGRLRPGYGYDNIKDKTDKDLYPENDGLYLVDINSNKSKLIFSIKEAYEYKHNETMDGVEHKFNHIEFSPEGNKVMFLHRWKKNNIGYSRLLTLDLDNNELCCLADDVMVSHSCWKDNGNILSWARKKDIGDRYFLFKDKSDIFEIIGERDLNVDGHPSYSPCNRYVLTDTYPNKFRMKELIIFDTLKNKKNIIGRYYAPFKFDGDYRCDFHPRWSPSGRYISFDSSHEGLRKQYIIKNPFKEGENE